MFLGMFQGFCVGQAVRSQRDSCRLGSKPIYFFLPLNLQLIHQRKYSQLPPPPPTFGKGTLLHLKNKSSDDLNAKTQGNLSDVQSKEDAPNPNSNLNENSYSFLKANTKNKAVNGKDDVNKLKEKTINKESLLDFLQIERVDVSDNSQDKLANILFSPSQTNEDEDFISSTRKNNIDYDSIENEDYDSIKQSDKDRKMDSGGLHNSNFEGRKKYGNKIVTPTILTQDRKRIDVKETFKGFYKKNDNVDSNSLKLDEDLKSKKNVSIFDNIFGFLGSILKRDNIPTNDLNKNSIDSKNKDGFKLNDTQQINPHIVNPKSDIQNGIEIFDPEKLNEQVIDTKEYKSPYECTIDEVIYGNDNGFSLNHQKSKDDSIARGKELSIPNYMMTRDPNSLKNHNESTNAKDLLDKIDSQIQIGMHVSKKVLESQPFEVKDFYDNHVSPTELWRTIVLLSAGNELQLEKNIDINLIISQLNSAADVFMTRNFINEREKINKSIKIKINNFEKSQKTKTPLNESSMISPYTPPEERDALKKYIFSRKIIHLLKNGGIPSRSTEKSELFLINSLDLVNKTLDIIQPFFATSSYLKNKKASKLGNSERIINLKQINKIFAVGLDIEMVTFQESQFPSILQVAITEDIVLIFNIFNICKDKGLESRNFARVLKKDSPKLLSKLINLISDPAIIKTGVGIGKDCSLLSYYGFKTDSVSSAGIVPLDEIFANMGLPQRSLIDIAEALALNARYKAYASGTNWGVSLFDINLSHLVYAAEDARISLLIFNILKLSDIEYYMDDYLKICKVINESIYNRFKLRTSILEKTSCRLPENLISSILYKDDDLLENLKL